MIRDALAANLSVLEPGLTLVQPEFTLRELGEYCGRIDILARDEFGQFVIIEVKASDATAREALHELHKYSALLPHNLNVPAREIRRILAATEWRELRRPFSEFAASFLYPIVGYRLVVDDVGRPTLAEKVSPVPPLALHQLSEQHTILYFATEEQRDVAAKRTGRLLDKEGFPGAFLIRMELLSGPPNVMHRCALYVACYRLPAPDGEQEAERRQEELDAYMNENPDSVPSSLDELRLSRIFDSTGKLRQSLEGSSPRKFSIMLRDWRVTGVDRTGARPGADAIPDADVVELVAGVNREVNPLGLVRTVSPRFRANWRNAVEASDRFLRDEGVWRKGVSAFLHEVEREMPEASVAITLHVVDNLLFAMREQFANGTPALPFVEVSASNETEVRVLRGLFRWDGETWPDSAEEVWNDLVAKDPTLAIAPVNRVCRVHHDEVLMRHGLERALLLIRDEDKVIEMNIGAVTADGRIERTKETAETRLLFEWLSEHHEYFVAFDAWRRSLL